MLLHQYVTARASCDGCSASCHQHIYLFISEWIESEVCFTPALFHDARDPPTHAELHTHSHTRNHLYACRNHGRVYSTTIKALKTMDECTHTRLVFAYISTFLTTKIHIIQSLNASNKDVFKSHQEQLCIVY